MKRPIPEGVKDGVIFDVGRTPGISFRDADAGSEVARLNQTSEGIPADRDGIPRNGEEDPRDGAIRALVNALNTYLMAGHKEARRLASIEAKAALALAKQCGCSENSSS